MTKRRPRPRFMLIAMGIALGYLARLVLGPPESELQNENKFQSPLPEQRQPDASDEIAATSLTSRFEDAQAATGLVPPIMTSFSPRAEHRNLPTKNQSPEEDHWQSAAHFEPHGEMICASGCALSRHPTKKLTTAKLQQLLNAFAEQSPRQSNAALDELLFYGPQTKALLSKCNSNPLKGPQEKFLVEQLRQSHVSISIRVVDEEGVVRTWLEPTVVPLDRRHVFEMQTKRLQPLVTSGTVKRVGLDHLWVRL